jgi:hypothetical protein
MSRALSYPEAIESADRIVIRSPMRPGMRLLLAALGLFPLLAPYELLLRIHWQSYLHPFFFLAAVVSGGALLVSAFLFLAAIAGLSSELAFDRRVSLLTYTFAAPVVRRTTRAYPFSAIARLETGERDWSDGPASYHLRIVMNDGKTVESGSSSSREEIESLKSRVDFFLSRAAIP